MRCLSTQQRLCAQQCRDRAIPCSLPLPQPWRQQYYERSRLRVGSGHKLRQEVAKLHLHVSAAASAGSAGEAGEPASSNDSSSTSGGAGGASAVYAALVSLCNRLTGLFPLWVAGSALLALWQPASFTWFRKEWVNAGLSVIMLGMGATIKLEDLTEVLRSPLRVAIGCTLQYTIMPLMGLLVSRGMGLPLPFAIGICLVACCPGGTASNVVTYLARADVPLSVLMTTASTFLAIGTTPLLTKLLVGKLVAVDASGLFMSTLQVVLAPVLAGATLNRLFPSAMEALAPFSALLAVAVVALVCASVMASNATAVLAAGPQLLLSVFALHAGGFTLGYGVSKALGMPEKVARTNSIETGMQNSALACGFAMQHFPAYPLAPVPCVISACMHSLMGSLLAGMWRRAGTGGEDKSNASEQGDGLTAAL